MSALLRSVRLALTVLLASGTVALAPRAAVAQDEDEEDDEGADDEGDDDGGGDDDGSEAEDEDEDEDEGEGEDGEAEEQPPVTAGGLYTKQTYPIAETLRPLTLTEGITEATLGFNIDLSAKQAFETWFGVVEGRYGLADNLELQFGTAFKLAGVEGGAAGPNKGRLDIGIEPAIVYDMVDFRFTAEMPINPGTDDPFKLDLVIGFPFRYRPVKQVAVFALDRLMTIHAVGGGKPDLTAGVGAIFQPIDMVALIARAELTVPRFDTEFLLVPATFAVQLTPDNRIDIGLEFTFANVKQPEGSPLGPFDQRFLLLYAAARL
jgi:hypothetical protein